MRDHEAIRGSRERFAGAFRMRHHAHHGVSSIVVAIASGKDNDAKFHVVVGVTKYYCSASGRGGMARAKSVSRGW